MFERTKELIEKIKYRMSKEACYDEMEGRGIAVFGICNGVTGGDRFTDYLNYSCVDCPYFKGLKKEN